MDICAVLGCRDDSYCNLKEEIMAQQSAVDWLFEQIPVEWSSTKYAFDAYQQALQMEKEQIISAWIATDNELQRIAAEQYYNETFGGKI